MTSTPRQRKASSKAEKEKEAEQAEPIDEVQQQQVVDQLREEALEQMELAQSIFSTVCTGAMMLCLLLGVTTSEDIQGWMQVIIAVVLHWGAIQIAATAKPGAAASYGFSGTYVPTLFMLLSILGVAASIYTTNSSNIKLGSKRHFDDHGHHLSLALSNVVTMLGALYLKHDSQSTKKALEQLEQSKYHFKSL